MLHQYQVPDNDKSRPRTLALALMINIELTALTLIALFYLSFAIYSRVFFY